MNLAKLTLLASFTSIFAVSVALAQDSDVATKFDKAPVPVKTPPPEYPASMNGTTGLVSVLVVIAEDGSVIEASVSKSTHAEFEQPSVTAVRKWKFKPAEVNGQPVKAKVSIPVRFNA